MTAVLLVRCRVRDGSEASGADGGAETEAGAEGAASASTRLLSDRQWALLILFGFSFLAVLIAFLVQHFVGHASAAAND